MTDEQKNAVDHAQKILRAVKLYDLAAVLAHQPVLSDDQIAEFGYEHSDEHDEPLFAFDRAGFIACVHAILASQPAAPKNPEDAPEMWRGDSNAALAWACGWNECLEASKPAAPSVAQDERGAKPCPFCGGAAEVHERNTDDGKPFYVQCDGCYIEVAYAGTREASLAIWNARAASTSANVAQPIHTIGGVPVDHSDDVSITREEYENLLRMVTDVAQGAEAVAWAVMNRGGYAKFVTNDEEEARRWKEVYPTTIPLFAAPPAQTALTDDARDAARWRRVQHQYSANEIDAMTAAQSASGEKE